MLVMHAYEPPQGAENPYAGATSFLDLIPAETSAKLDRFRFSEQFRDALYFWAIAIQLYTNKSFPRTIVPRVNGVLSYNMSPAGNQVIQTTITNEAYLYTIDPDTHQIIDTKALQHPIISTAHPMIRAATFSHDGSIVATARYNQFFLWDTATGNLIKTITTSNNNADIISHIGFNSNDTELCTVTSANARNSWTPTIKRWHPNGNLIAIQPITENTHAIQYRPGTNDIYCLRLNIEKEMSDIVIWHSTGAFETDSQTEQHLKNMTFDATGNLLFIQNQETATTDTILIRDMITKEYLPPMPLPHDTTFILNPANATIVTYFNTKYRLLTIKTMLGNEDIMRIALPDVSMINDYNNRSDILWVDDIKGIGLYYLYNKKIYNYLHDILSPLQQQLLYMAHEKIHNATGEPILDLSDPDFFTAYLELHPIIKHTFDSWLTVITPPVEPSAPRKRKLPSRD